MLAVRKGTSEMLRIENHIGAITVTQKYLKALISRTAASCFGVSGMNDCNPLAAFVLPKSKQKGVFIRTKNNKLRIDLHITVSYGVNASAITDSIVKNVRFAVEQATDIPVDKINVFIDKIT
ncbi:MAG: Asp23/Gls24 family envelope stress response protein [Oscillospiraceae bacterium]|nr:Asp23/Gls24 family envelope stress response protein [Oscillospiraceae bacterium]